MDIPNYTKEEFISDISHGNEIEFNYKGNMYFIGGYTGCYYVADCKTGKYMCSYPTREELAEEGHIGEMKLKDIFDELDIEQVY